MVGIWRQEADRADSIVGEEAPRIIYGFTPINGPTLGNPNMTGPPPADNMASLSFTPPKTRKLKPPSHTPVRRQVEGASQLWTPPPTIARDDSSRPKRPRLKGYEATANSRQGWTNVSKQPQTEPADAILDEERDFGLTGLSGKVDSYEVLGEQCQHTPARTVALSNPFVSSTGLGSSDGVNGTGLFTGRWWASRDIASGAKECRSLIGPSGVQGQDFASNKDPASNPAPLRPSENCVASDSDNGQRDCIEIEEDVEQTIHQHRLAPGGDKMGSFDDTASFQRYSHVGHFVHTSDDYGNEFLLDDNDTDDLIELSGGQAIVEPPSSLHLSPSQRLQVDDKGFPVRMRGLKATSLDKDIFILKNGVYAPVETTTTMDALNSDLDTGQFLGHARANIGKKLMAINTPETKSSSISNDEEIFEFDEEDETELVDLTAVISQDGGATLGHTATAPPTPPEATPARPCAPETARSTFTVPIPSSSPQSAPRSTSDGRLEPFVRPPFPQRVRDRSPIVDISSSGLLRTCFRIGEALNAASEAFRTGTDVIIELFARVRSSTREIAGYKQHIDFADLFHSERPPFLSGTHELWKDGGRWEEDSRRLLDEDGRGKMCRAVGRLKRDSDTKMWKMAVLNIWEATWDDVAWAKGVVFA